MKLIPFAALACIAMTAGAQTKYTVDKQQRTYGDSAQSSTTVSTPVSKNVSVGVNATTTYDKPSKGADGPAPGNQVGSSTNTTVGPAIIIRTP
jgi:hypothetical protein